MKAIPLIAANLKSFMRNWRSVVLLLVFPLLLIGTIFLSFSPDGITRIPVGIIDPLQHAETSQFEEVSSSFLETTKYNSVDGCVHDMKLYKQYCCIEIIGGDSFIIDVHYDNTREPIIWEILERIKTSVDVLQAEKSIQMTSDLLSQFNILGTQIGNFETQVDSADDIIDEYIETTDDSILSLREAHSDLDSTIDQMDEDINDINSKKSTLQYQKNSLYYSVTSKLNQMEDYLNLLTVPAEEQYMLSYLRQQSDDIRDEIEDYNDEADETFSDVDNRINTYRVTSEKGKDYLGEIDEGVDSLHDTKSNLYDYKFNLLSLKGDLTGMRSSLAAAGTINPELIAAPVKFLTYPLYIPEVRSKISPENLMNGIIKGINLIGLQTLFPKLLLLIVMFLSLLISTFITLSEINSPANVRVSTIRGIAVHEFFSTYVSSLLIILPPILIVLALGYMIFELSIPFISVFLTMFLLSSTFIMVGMLLAYLVVKESITMLIMTFLLMFLLFFSGYILPIERMSTVSKVIAEITPGKISLDIFNQLTFYSQPFPKVLVPFSMLLIWFVLAVIIAYSIKVLKDL